MKRETIQTSKRGLFIYQSLICMLFFFVVFGCKKDDSQNERIAILAIEPKTVLNGTIPESDQLVDCMVAKEEGTNTTHYLYIGRIDGFEYEEGFTYRIKVLISQIKNPPMDGYTENFKLIELISKVHSDV